MSEGRNENMREWLEAQKRKPSGGLDTPAHPEQKQLRYAGQFLDKIIPLVMPTALIHSSQMSAIYYVLVMVEEYVNEREWGGGAVFPAHSRGEQAIAIITLVTMLNSYH